MHAALLSIFLVALFAPVLHRKGSLVTPILFSLFALGIGVYFLSFHGSVTDGKSQLFTYTWSAALSVELSFLVDGLSLFFALLVSFIGALILLYSGYYMKEKEQANRFFGMLLFFMGSMLGLVLAADLISLFVFWEMTSLSSYLLIGFKHTDEKARQAAHQAWIVTAAGGLVLLAGLILLGMAGHGYSIPELLTKKDLVAESPYLTAIVALLLIGAFSKSAQYPFHFWLPTAMEAPSPVSAYLHSATMVKAGVYLVLRLNPVFADNATWQTALAIVGGTTMVLAAAVAFHADDLKRVLAYTTISALGIFFLMLGIGSEEAVKAAVVYIFAHACYKASLFLVAGVLDHDCGTRLISELGVKPKRMPLTAAAAALAALSMAGIIPFLGYIGKEKLYEAALHHSGYLHMTLIALVVSSVLFVVVSMRIVVDVFMRKSARDGRRGETVGETSPFMYLPPLALGLAGLTFGLFPEFGVKAVLMSASESISDAVKSLDMSLWHGFNTVFALSVATVVAGLFVYWLIKYFGKLLGKVSLFVAELPETLYNGMMRGFEGFAEFQTRTLQSGYLRRYVSICLGTLFVVFGYYSARSGFLRDTPISLELARLRIYEVAVLLLVLFTITFVFISRSRLAVLASIGVTGYGIALLYALFSAPDVAITQFLVETIGLMLIAIILPKLPLIELGRSAGRKGYLVGSCAFGALMTYVTLVTMSREEDSKLKSFFLENSEPLGKGENAVNVILVDFRALDTLGEISVLIITMIGIVAFLLKTGKEVEL